MRLIEEVWNIRGAIDNGIKHHDPELIKLALDKLENCYKNNHFQYTNASCSINFAYWTDEQKRRDKFENANKLMKNARNIYDKYVNGNKDALISFGEQPKSVITTLWVARAMLDDVQNKVGKKKFENRQRELLEIFESIEQAINKCIHEADTHAYVYEERKFLSELDIYLQQIRKELFGDQQLLTGFAYHSQNY